MCWADPRRRVSTLSVPPRRAVATAFDHRGRPPTPRPSPMPPSIVGASKTRISRSIRGCRAAPRRRPTAVAPLGPHASGAAPLWGRRGWSVEPARGMSHALPDVARTWRLGIALRMRAGDARRQDETALWRPRGRPRLHGPLFDGDRFTWRLGRLDRFALEQTIRYSESESRRMARSA